MRNQAGFTLIELAIVLSIIGALIGGSLVAIGPALQKTYQTQTTQNMDQLENALILFAIRNNRLPCPADGSLTTSSATYGLEQTATGTYTTTACSTTAKLPNSVIPWKTLGVNEQYSFDGWHHRISYFPANAAIAGVSGSLVYSDSTNTGGGVGVPNDNCLQRNTTVATGSNRATSCDPTNVYSFSTAMEDTYPFDNYIAVYSINGGACSTELTQPNTNTANAAFSGTDTCGSALSPAVLSNSALTATTAPQQVPYDGNRAAYVLISHGPSGWYGWTNNGTQISPPNTSYTLKIYNNTSTGTNGSGTFSMAGPAGSLGFVQSLGQIGALPNVSASYFDDIVRWRSPAYIIQQCGSGGCGNP